MSKTADFLDNMGMLVGPDEMEFFRNRRDHGTAVVRVYKEWANGTLDTEECLTKISQVAEAGSDAEVMAHLLIAYC